MIIRVRGDLDLVEKVCYSISPPLPLSVTQLWGSGERRIGQFGELLDLSRAKVLKALGIESTAASQGKDDRKRLA